MPGKTEYAKGNQNCFVDPAPGFEISSIDLECVSHSIALSEQGNGN